MKKIRIISVLGLGVLALTLKAPGILLDMPENNPSIPLTKEVQNGYKKIEKIWQQNNKRSQQNLISRDKEGPRIKIKQLQTQLETKQLEQPLLQTQQPKKLSTQRVRPIKKTLSRTNSSPLLDASVPTGQTQTQASSELFDVSVPTGQTQT